MNSLVKTLETSLIEPLFGENKKEEGTSAQAENPQRNPLAAGPPRYPQGQPYHPYNDPYHHDPFGVGGADLDPFGRGRGGMIMDPFHGGRGGPMGGGGVPRPRFDPPGPLGPMGPRGPRGGPNFGDEMPPPGFNPGGFGGMFM